MNNSNDTLVYLVDEIDKIFKEAEMNDDLILCVSFVSKSKTLDKFVLHVAHGHTNGVLEDYEYFNEDHVFDNFMKLIPKDVADFVDFIVEVEEIYACVHVKENNEAFKNKQ